MKILLIDNYDSFTYNLVHYLEGHDCEVTVWRNDEINFSQISEFDKIVLSPGPGLPKEAGQLMQVIQHCFNRQPILGVCLGFQAIVEFLDGEIYNQNLVKHGQKELCELVGTSKLFQNIPSKFNVGLYHSWAARKENFPEELKITAYSENDVIMACEHQNLPVCGVQFHPESILSDHGREIIGNFLKNFK
ncbi:MAG: aminodeoxychorismate/anthranilate synthase component II [Crocinitomicaceae bacterium]